MDTQMEFIQIWASACQKLVDDLVRHIETDGMEKAIDWWVAYNVDRVKKMEATPITSWADGFARDVVVVGSAYVDLMLRYGVFNDDTTD